MEVSLGEDTDESEGVRATEAPTTMSDAVGHCRPTSTIHHPPIINTFPARSTDGPGTIPTGSTQNANRISGTRCPQSDKNHNNKDDDKRPPSRRRRIDVSPCSTCSRNSTCQQAPTANKAGCECKAAGRRCISCACLRNCRNKQARITARTGSGPNFFSAAPTGLASQQVLPSSSLAGLCQASMDSDSEYTPTTQPPLTLHGAGTTATADPSTAAAAPSLTHTDELLGTQDPPPPESQEHEEDATATSTQAPPDPDDDAAVAEAGNPPAQAPPALLPLTMEEGSDCEGYQLT
jgi:hypothetical protein